MTPRNWLTCRYFAHGGTDAPLRVGEADGLEELVARAAGERAGLGVVMGQIGRLPAGGLGALEQHLALAGDLHPDVLGGGLRVDAPKGERQHAV